MRAHSFNVDACSPPSILLLVTDEVDYTAGMNGSWFLKAFEGYKLTAKSMASVLPIWLRFIWLCLAPLGLSFCFRIAWEETFLTWSQGQQAVGFSLAHVHPGFFEMGLFCSFGLGLWLLPAAIYMIRRRKAISWSDVVMMALSLFAVAVIFVPESVFA